MHFRKSVSASNPINKLVLQTNQMCNYATYNMNICTKYINSRQTICDGRQEEALQWQWRWFCFWFWFVHVSYERLKTTFYIYLYIEYIEQTELDQLFAVFYVIFLL